MVVVGDNLSMSHGIQVIMVTKNKPYFKVKAQYMRGEKMSGRFKFEIILLGIDKIKLLTFLKKIFSSSIVMPFVTTCSS